MVLYTVLPLTHMKMKLITSYDWTGKSEDKTLLELIENENILVTPHIAFFSQMKRLET